MHQVKSPAYLACREFLLGGVQAGQRILDVGCGDGDLMRALSARGCAVEGVEVNPALVESCRSSGLQVSYGRAEALPFPDATFDGIVCSVVLPYTDERRAVAEWSRVLKPRGFVNATCHGLGYGLQCAISGPGMSRRYYGVRMLLNTFWYRLTRSRLPWPLGDTLCQTERAIRSYLQSCDLAQERELVAHRTLGLPVFLGVRAVKRH